MGVGDYILLAIGLLVGFLIFRYSLRLIRYFVEPGILKHGRFHSLLGISVGVLGMLIGLVIFVLAVFFMIFGGPVFPVSSG